MAVIFAASAVPKNGIAWSVILKSSGGGGLHHISPVESLRERRRLLLVKTGSVDAGTDRRCGYSLHFSSFYQTLFMLDKVRFVLFGNLIMLAGMAHAVATLPDMRTQFLQAEKFIQAHKNSDYLNLARQLKSYPLYPYLHYQWLKNNLDRHDAIEDFILSYNQTRYAGLLKNKWLRHLAKQKNWEELIKHYRSSSSASLQCDYYWAKYNSGQKTTALKAAKKLWLVGYSQPANCDPLFSRLMKSKYFTRDMLWQRFQAALENGRAQLATYIKNLMSTEDGKIAELWLKVHRNPELVTRHSDWHRGYSQAGLIFAHAVDRIARRNSATATQIWDRHKDQFIIPQYRAQQIERRLALGLAFRLDRQAYDRLDKLTKSDKTVREWQIRSALREQNWRHVEESLTKLSAEEKNEPHWQYWLARTREHNGQYSKANDLFARVAKDRSFYGFMAADKLDQKIQLNHQPVPISEDEIVKFRQNNDFQMVAEFRAIGRIEEAKRQWWYAISKLDGGDLLVAAKLAEQWQWDQEAIFTIAKAKYWDDMNLRFPIKYFDHIKVNADRQDLDPAIVFGLIRRESAFKVDARSPVGARGLMQIMPKTGKQIARELKERWGSVNSLLNPEINVKYGTFYYKKLLEQFDGHYALAAAAYNAGPHRVKRWLPEDEPIAADIWIETIPFKETRGYVSAVLTYALIYQRRLQREVLKMKDFMRDILPG